MSNYLQRYFYYSRQERLGACFLMFICLGFFIVPKFYHFFYTPPNVDFDLSVYQKEIEQFEMMLIKKEKPQRYTYKPKDFIAKADSTKAPVELFYFDPNTIALKDLEKLGFPPKVAYTLLNYRKKGGIFKKKEDLKKVYGLQDTIYQKLAPFIQIKLAKAPPKKIFAQNIPENIPTSFEKPILQIDINKATAPEWQSLRGIGPVLSNRIVKFRDKLGGFSEVEQVGSTYGLPDSTFQSIKPLLIKSDLIRKIAINKVSEEELKQHPYISWKQAKIVILYRNNHGSFKDLESLSMVEVLSKEKLKQLEPYLSFDF